MEFACADVTVEGAGEEAWMGSDVVFLAALVGEDTGSKMRILEALAGKLGPGTLVVARSARGLRSVLYPVSRSCALL
jgi:nicotianamine synthase